MVRKTITTKQQQVDPDINTGYVPGAKQKNPYV